MVHLIVHTLSPMVSRWKNHSCWLTERRERLAKMKARVHVLSRITPWPWPGEVGSWKRLSTWE